MNKPNRSDFQTQIQNDNQTIYAQRKDGVRGHFIQYYLPSDFNNAHRSFVGQAFFLFIEKKMELQGTWVKLSIREMEAEMEARNLLSRQYQAAMHDWKLYREADILARYEASVSVPLYPAWDENQSRAAYNEAVEAHSETLKALIPAFVSGEKELNIATAQYLDKLLTGYVLYVGDYEIIPQGWNSETGLLTVLVIDEQGLPKKTMELTFGYPVTLTARANAWRYEWRVNPVFNSPSYGLEVEATIDGRRLDGRIEFTDKGATLAWASSHWTTEEASELIAIHTYLLSLAIKWEAKLEQARVMAEAPQRPILSSKA